MPPALEERRILTVLFADLSGFTPLASKLDPEEVREAANLCFEHLNKAIAKEGGTVLKYEGDLVMALFGLPLAHEDDPERAVRASPRSPFLELSGGESCFILLEFNLIIISNRFRGPKDKGREVHE